MGVAFTLKSSLQPPAPSPHKSKRRLSISIYDKETHGVNWSRHPLPNAPRSLAAGANPAAGNNNSQGDHQPATDMGLPAEVNPTPINALVIIQIYFSIWVNN
ncbi:hypothetical protein PtB15_13B317 [Puccinia triticina]|nr:hypothetical protein PtB15_13B317 [Puccinia triticina]